MNFTDDMIAEDEKRWHARDVVTELGYCSTYMRDRKDMTNLDIRFYAYIMRKANELLKAQEPRVMTENELEGYISSFDGEARVWIEHKKLGLYCASLWSRNPSRSDQNFYDVMHECYFDRSEIGKWWRPWTSRPTDEQREATPWVQ